MGFTTVFTLIGLFFIAQGEACRPTRLTANTTTASFTSHPEFHINDQYLDNRYDCWSIVAPMDHVIEAWTDENFHLESGYDFLNLFCGRYGDDGHIGQYSGDFAIPSDMPVHTSGPGLYVEFTTDHSIRHTGFKLYYRAIHENSSSQHDCVDDDDYEVHIHFYRNRYHDDDHVTAGQVIRIVIVCLIIVGACVGCAVGVYCCVRSANRRSAIPGHVVTYSSGSGVGGVTGNGCVVGGNAQAQNGYGVGVVNMTYTPPAYTEEKVRPPDYDLGSGQTNSTA